MPKSSFHRNTGWRPAILILACVCFWAGADDLHADVVRLKDGRTIIGEMGGDQGDGKITITTLAGEERIAPEDILKAEVGYHGFPACVVRVGSLKERNCGAILHLLESGHAIVAFGEGFVNAQDIPEDQIYRIDFYRSEEDQRYTSVIGRGTRLEVTLRNPDPKAQGPLVFKGTTEKLDEETITLRLADGLLREFKENELLSIAYVPLKNEKPPRPGGFGRFMLKLTPGVYQYSEREYWKGSFFLFSFVALGTGLGVEYAKARKQERDANASWSFWLFHDTRYETKYRYYQRAQRAIGGAMFLLYMGHIMDAFVFRKDPPTAYFEPVFEARIAGGSHLEGVAGLSYVIRF